MSKKNLVIWAGVFGILGIAIIAIGAIGLSDGWPKLLYSLVLSLIPFGGMGDMIREIESQNQRRKI